MLEIASTDGPPNILSILSMYIVVPKYKDTYLCLPKVIWYRERNFYLIAFYPFVAVSIEMVFSLVISSKNCYFLFDFYETNYKTENSLNLVLIILISMLVLLYV